MGETTGIGEVLSAWEEINPPMALAPRAEPPSGCSVRPATSDQFRDELEACLALVAPVGMDEAARAEWLAIAWATLKHLPADLLSRGCAAARRQADHPSKIVPLIEQETRQSFDWRRKAIRAVQPRALPSPDALPKRSLLDRRGEAMTEAETMELNKLLEGLGATARYRADGSRFVIESDAGKGG